MNLISSISVVAVSWCLMMCLDNSDCPLNPDISWLIGVWAGATAHWIGS